MTKTKLAFFAAKYNHLELFELVKSDLYPCQKVSVLRMRNNGINEILLTDTWLRQYIKQVYYDDKVVINIIDVYNYRNTIRKIHNE